MDAPITRAEHEEFVKRIDAENNRQNRRIDLLEKSVQPIQDWAMSARDLATNMKNMSEELRSQGEKLETLEGRDGEMWRKAVGYILTAVIGIVVGFIFTRLGM